MPTHNYDHDCTCGVCNLCNLAICSVCGLYEGALTTECPGKEFNPHHIYKNTGSTYEDLIYQGELDYRNGEWKEVTSQHSPEYHRPCTNCVHTQCQGKGDRAVIKCLERKVNNIDYYREEN